MKGNTNDNINTSNIIGGLDTHKTWVREHFAEVGNKN